jgi:lambda family phage portal protein
MTTLPALPAASPILSIDGTPMKRTSIGAYGDTAHDAASRDKELRSWNPLPSSADSAYLPEISTIVPRSDDLVRNEPLAKSGVNAKVDSVVGSGLLPRPNPDWLALGKTKEWADDWARKVRGKFTAYLNSRYFDISKQANFHDATRLHFRTKLVKGESVALPLWIDDRGAKWATTFLAVDPDRISNPQWMPDTDTMRGGVEIDRYGTPVAVHIQKAHPADAAFGFVNNWEWERIPVETEWGRRLILHIFDRERADQHRGLTSLSAVMAEFKVFHNYKRAELDAAVANALIATVTKSPQMTFEETMNLFDGDRDRYLKERAEFVLKLRSGAVLPMFPGESLESYDPSRPNSAFGPFVDAILKQIAAGLDLPYEILLRDFTKGNYSSIRAAFMQAWKTFATARDLLISQWCDPVYELWLEEAIDSGEVEADDDWWENRDAWTRCRWLGDGKGWLDPVREGQAAQLRIAAGISTYEDECMEQGKDWEEVFAQRAVEQQRMKELGLDQATILQTVATAPQVPVDDPDR